MRSAISFQIDRMKSSVFVFYVVIIAIYIVMGGVGFASNQGSNGSITVGAMEMATMVFLFIVGLCSFREEFHMLIQCGVGRIRIFQSHLVTKVIVSVGLALADTLIRLLGHLLTLGTDNVSISGFLNQVYPSVFKDPFHVGTILLNILLLSIGYLAMLSIGYFMAAASYRGGRKVKIAFAAGLPVGLFVVLPLVDDILFNGKLILQLLKFIDQMLGISAAEPWRSFASFLVVTVIINLLSGLLLRKAQVME